MNDPLSHNATVKVEQLLSDEAKGAIYEADRRYQNVDPREQSEGGWATALLEAALGAALSHNAEDQGARKYTREQLLDDDGPILLEVREAVCGEVEACGLRDEEGEGMYADHGAAVHLANTVSDRVKKSIAEALDKGKGGEDG